MPALPAGLRSRLGAAFLLLLATEAGLRLAGTTRAPLVFDVGPSTPAYLEGFTHSEERPPVTSRWARARAAIEWPLASTGGRARLTLRAARFLEREVRVQVFAAAPGSGRHALGGFDVRPGRFRETDLAVELPAGRLRLELVSESPQDLALALDWVKVTGPRWFLPPRVLAPRLLPLVVFAAALVAGCSVWGAAGAGAVGLLLLAAGFARDPFACVHVAMRLALPALLLGSACGALLRTRPGGRSVTLLFLLGYLLKGALLFHPSYFYNDVRNNRRFVEALRDDPGTLQERVHAAQVRIGVAYPRQVAGRRYAFPYSPVFFLPFTLAGRTPVAVDEALKHVAVAAASADVVLVFLMAGLVFGPGSGRLAALLALCLPVFYSRLLLALWSTLGGHVFDSLALLAALAWAARPASRARLWSWAAAVQASYLTYVASLFNMAFFCGGLGLLVPRWRVRAWAVGALAALVTVGLLYAPFTRLFVSEILPAYLGQSAAPGVDPQATATAGEAEAPDPDHGRNLRAALARIPLFYGWLLPPLAVVGLWLARRQAPAPAGRVLAAYGLAFAALVALRGLAGGLFKDMKEIEFVAPLMALSAGAALEELARHGRAGRLATFALTAAIAVWALTWSWSAWRTWTALLGA